MYYLIKVLLKQKYCLTYTTHSNLGTASCFSNGFPCITLRSGLNDCLLYKSAKL